MKRTKIIERYTSLGENIFESGNWAANMYRIIPYKSITYSTIKLERHEE